MKNHILDSILFKITGLNKIQIYIREVITMRFFRTILSKIISFFDNYESNFELSAEMMADIIYAERRYDYERNC